MSSAGVGFTVAVVVFPDAWFRPFHRRVQAATIRIVTGSCCIARGVLANSEVR